MDELVETALRQGGITFHCRDPREDALYTLALQLHLFGGQDLVRLWGRCPRKPSRAMPSPRRLVEHYDDEEGLCLALAKAVSHRLDRGYRASPLPRSPRLAAAA